MKIQIIDNRQIFNSETDSNEILVSHYSSFHALDAFDVTVIDLQDSGLWCSSHADSNVLLCRQDLESVASAINASRKSKILVLLPQNSIYQSGWVSPYSGRKGYRQKQNLKDMIPLLQKKMLKGILPDDISLVAGKSTTRVKDYYLEADFSLLVDERIDHEIKLISDAESCTAFSFAGKAYSTIEVTNSHELKALLCEIFPEEQTPFIAPEWLKSISFLNQDEVESSIDDLRSKIAQLEEQKNEQIAVLDDYERKKSILCTKGQDLQDIVVSILQEMLNDEEEFADVNEEDYRFETENMVFVFEVKGSKGGLTRKNLSDTDGHVQITKDELETVQDAREVKGCLIFAEQIDTNLSERDDYPEKQLILAKQYRLALIPTSVLLVLYEHFCKGMLDAERFLQMIVESEGLVVFDSLSNE